MNNWFFRFLTSGFGTGMAAAKALGWTIAIGLVGLWIFIWIVKKIYVAIAGEKVPNFKDGEFAIQLTAVGDNPKAVKKQLCQFKGYSSSLAKKVMSKTPSLLFVGCDQQTAEDIQVVLEETGATVDIMVPKE